MAIAAGEAGGASEASESGGVGEAARADEAGEAGEAAGAVRRRGGEAGEAVIRVRPAGALGRRGSQPGVADGAGPSGQRPGGGRVYEGGLVMIDVRLHPLQGDQTYIDHGKRPRPRRASETGGGFQPDVTGVAGGVGLRRPVSGPGRPGLAGPVGRG